MKSPSLLASCAVVLLAGAAVAGPKPLSWDNAFSQKGAPASVHAVVSYSDEKGKDHTLELWRDGDARLRRSTDGRLDLLARKGSDGEYGYELVDHVGHRVIQVSRRNLARIGVFSSFSELGGILVKPPREHQITPSARPMLDTPMGKCRWLTISAKGAPNRDVCWSDKWKVPLLIENVTPGKPGTAVLKVNRIEANTKGDAAFHVETPGYYAINADQDIDPSGD